MDKKQIMIGSVFGGIALYAIPIFVDIGIGSLFFKIAGAGVMLVGVVYFVAGDVFTGGNKQSKEIKRKLKAGEINEMQAFELEKQSLQIELKRAQMKHQIEMEKAKIKKLKQPAGGGLMGGSSGQGKSKMPDILGNLGGVIGGQQPQQQSKQPRHQSRHIQQHDTLNSLGGFVNTPANQPKPKSRRKRKPKKNDSVHVPRPDSRKPTRVRDSWY